MNVEISSAVWDTYWGMGYDSPLKEEHLAPVLHTLERQNNIGEVVVDVGSGAWSVTRFLPNTHKIITVDVSGAPHQSPHRLHVQYDIEKLCNVSRMSCRKVLVSMAEFLGLDLRTQRNHEPVDTMIFSEILNYVDYQKTLRSFGAFLKRGGRYVIMNKPERGFKELFAEQGLRSNEALYRFLKEENFTIEQKKFPWRAKGKKEEDAEMIILVARKKMRNTIFHQQIPA